jgi:DNA replication protein DnaC
MKTFEEIKNQKIEDLVCENEKKSDSMVKKRSGFTKSSWVEKDYSTEFDVDVSLQEITSNIPPIFKDTSFDKIDTRLKDATRSLIVNENPRGLYLYGQCGTGKTYSIWAMYKRLRVNDVPIYVVSSIDFLSQLRSDFNSGTKYYEAYQDYGGILVIDDIGTEKYSEWAGEMFYAIINKRYEQKLPTIFTSNYSIAEISDKFGDRIASRIVGMCDIIKLVGTDKRLIKET